MYQQDKTKLDEWEERQKLRTEQQIKMAWISVFVSLVGLFISIVVLLSKL